MIEKSVLAGALLLFSSTFAVAGPCNTANRDAGSGPVTTGKASETTGVASTSGKEHPPTSSMNKATENTATSSQDAQRQMQGQPTAADQSAKSGDVDEKGC